jgi:segregation and condensation protein A
MALSLAQDAIALLINLAEQGEIDPWDVKVIEVIDRFLSELAPSEQEPYEASLSQSGQAFLYASMLVLLKAETLMQADTPTAELASDDAILDELAVLDDGVPAGLPPYLEQRLRRRAAIQPVQRRRVTLSDLISQLQTIATALENPSPTRRVQRPRNQSRSQALRTISQLAHQENLSEMAVALEQFFIDHRDRLPPNQDWFDFDLLLELWCQMNTVGAIGAEAISALIPSNHDRVGVFWALLLLSAQSKVELAQEQFYQDLKVRPLSPEETPSALSPTGGQTD